MNSYIVSCTLLTTADTKQIFNVQYMNEKFFSYPVESKTTVFEERTGEVENFEGGNGDADLTAVLLCASVPCVWSISVLALCRGW